MEEKNQKTDLYPPYPFAIIFLRWIFSGAAFGWGVYILVDWKDPLAYLYVLYGVACLTLILPLSRCIHCYYHGKGCSVGWGKIAGYLFPKEDEAEYQKKYSYYILTYPLWLFPGLVSFFQLLLKRNLKYLIIFFGFIAIWFLGKLFLKWVCCGRCHQRDFCPAVPFRGKEKVE